VVNRDSYDVSLTITKRGITREGISHFVGDMQERLADGYEVALTLPAEEPPKALTNGQASPRGRTAVCFRFEETMDALERTGWDVKAAASILRITFERLRARLYVWTKKGLVEKVGVDQWRLV